MVAKWDMLVAMMLAQISWMEFAPLRHAFRGQDAITTCTRRVSIVGAIGRMTLEQPLGARR
jgi:hypothetical protein